MPLNNLAVSSFPVMTGIFGEGAAVGAFSGISISIGVVGSSWARCHCSSEIHRSTIAVSTAASKRRTKKRSVLSRNFRTPPPLLLYPGDDRHHAAHPAQPRHQAVEQPLAT